MTARGAGPGAPPLTARGVPLTARGVPEARSVPPPSQAGGIISCSSARRAGVTPREYLVEVLSPTRALELCTAAATIGGSVPAPWLLNAGSTSARPNEACSPRSPRSPGIGSPPLMLRPRESLNEAAGPSPGNVSTSSSEGDIRERLQQGLRPELRPSSVDAASPKDAKTQVPRLDKFPVLEQTHNQVPRMDLGAVPRCPETFPVSSFRPEEETKAQVPRLDLGIPTPTRSRLSAASNAAESHCYSSDSDSDYSEEGECVAELPSTFPPLVQLRTEFMPPPTPRRS